MRSHCWPESIQHCPSSRRHRKQKENSNGTDPCDCRGWFVGQYIPRIVLEKDARGVQEAHGAEQASECAPDNEQRSRPGIVREILTFRGVSTNVYSLWLLLLLILAVRSLTVDTTVVVDRLGMFAVGLPFMVASSRWWCDVITVCMYRDMLT